MPRYIALLKFTDQGARNLKDSTKRAHEFDRAAESAGVKVDGQYWCIGAYDGVLLLSADTEKKVFTLLADLATKGNVRTETLPLFSDLEFDSIVGKAKASRKR